MARILIKFKKAFSISLILVSSFFKLPDMKRFRSVNSRILVTFKEHMKIKKLLLSTAIIEPKHRKYKSFIIKLKLINKIRHINPFMEF